MMFSGIPFLRLFTDPLLQILAKFLSLTWISFLTHLKSNLLLFPFQWVHGINIHPVHQFRILEFSLDITISLEPFSHYSAILTTPCGGLLMGIVYCCWYACPFQCDFAGLPIKNSISFPILQTWTSLAAWFAQKNVDSDIKLGV